MTPLGSIKQPGGRTSRVLPSSRSARCLQPELVALDEPKPEPSPESEARVESCPAEASSSRLAVISDHPLIRLAVFELARQNNFCLCCAEATTAEEALRCVAESDPDVAFVDLSFSSGMGLHLIEELHSANPRTRLLASSPHDDLLYAGQVIGAGALGYLHRSAEPDEIQEAIQSVANGKTFVGRQFTQPFLGDGQSGTPFGLLTQREAQVFELIGQGDSTKRIARKLGLRTNTVETYRERIRGKLGAKDGADLVYRAIVWVLLNQ